MDRNIVVYAGEGALPQFLPGRHLHAAEVIASDWEQNCDLFIMPGGRDLPYHDALRGLGNQKIRRFVENGGTYLGICAGAYYGCARVVFDQGCPLEVCGDRELQFFSGTAVGPAYGKKTFDYHSNAGVRAALIRAEQGDFHAHYNGGCTFEGDLSQCDVLAKFLDLDGQPPAIIQCRVGKGMAILSGIHPEISASTLDLNDPFLAPLIPLFQNSESARICLWKSMLKAAQPVVSDR